MITIVFGSGVSLNLRKMYFFSTKVSRHEIQRCDIVNDKYITSIVIISIHAARSNDVSDFLSHKQRETDQFGITGEIHLLSGGENNNK